jgi:hypothetical protein
MPCVGTASHRSESSRRERRGRCTLCWRAHLAQLDVSCLVLGEREQVVAPLAVGVSAKSRDLIKPAEGTPHRGTKNYRRCFRSLNIHSVIVKCGSTMFRSRAARARSRLAVRARFGFPTARSTTGTIAAASEMAAGTRRGVQTRSGWKRVESGSATAPGGRRCLASVAKAPSMEESSASVRSGKRPRMTSCTGRSARSFKSRRPESLARCT